MPVDASVAPPWRRRVRWWVLAAVVVVVLGLGAAALRGRQPPPEAADESVVQALSSVAQATQRAVMDHQASPSEAAVGASAASASHAVPAGPIDPGCPPQWRALAGKPADAIDKVFRQMRPAALAHAGQLLASSPEAFERITGRLLTARSRDVDGPPDADTYLALVSEALSSNDPRVAALATQLCDTAPPEHATACSSMSAARWAAIDPDNVQAWLAVAAEALERSDIRAAREALGRAAQSRGSRLIWSDLMPLSNSTVLQSLPPVERQVLAADLIGVGGLLVNNGLLAISRLCSTDALTAPARRQECSAVAGLMIEHGDTLMEHGIGIGLARRSGWPIDRVDALAEEQRALSEAFADETNFGFDQPGPMTMGQACETYRRVEASFALVSNGNEMQAARRALQRQQATSAPK